MEYVFLVGIPIVVMLFIVFLIVLTLALSKAAKTSKPRLWHGEGIVEPEALVGGVYVPTALKEILEIEKKREKREKTCIHQE